MLSIITAVNGQMIEINNIQEDYGFVIISQGILEKPISYRYHILPINKTYLDITYDTLMKQFQSVKFYQNNMTNKYLTLAFKEKQIFLNRHKRGLANIVGDGLKFLFGTMNEEDRVNMEKALRDLKTNTVTSNEFNAMIDHINKENEILQKFQKETSRLQNKLTEKIYSDMFLDNVKLYLEHIQDIQLAIQLVRLGIINPKLIDVQTMTSMSTLEFEHIKTSIWLENDLIYFVLSIPTHFRTYKRLKIIPIPDKNHNELKINEEENYASKDNEIYRLQNNKIILENNECIRNLMNNNKTNCQYIENILPHITFSEPNIIITKNLETTEIEQNCNKLRIKIKGNNIIRFNNCKIKINDFEISVNQDAEEVNILPPAKDIENIVKDKISLPELKKHIENVNAKTDNYSLSLLIAIIITFLIILVLLIIFKIYFVKEKTNNVKSVNEDIEVSKGGRSDIHTSNIP